MSDITNMVGFETGGDEEAESVIGGAVVAVDQVASGSYALKASTAGDGFRLRNMDGGTSAIGLVRIVGIKVRFSSVSAGIFLVGEDSAGVDNFSIGLSSSSKLEVFDKNGISIDTGVLTIAIDRWYTIEFIWVTGSAISPFQVNVDETIDIGIVSMDVDGGVSDWAIILQAPTSNDTWFDDFYIMGDVVGVGDFLGADYYILATYQNTVEDGTDQGDTLDQGTWSDMADTPGVDEGAPAGFTASAAASGYTRMDEGARPGPLTDIVDDVIAAKWIWRAKRSGGGGTSHYIRYGAFDGTIDKLSERLVSLGTSYQNISQIRDGLGETDRVPEATDEYFVQGIRKTSGGRSFFVADMWAMILQNPSGPVPPPLAPPRRMVYPRGRYRYPHEVSLLEDL